MRQVYALAAALCERVGEEFPETPEAASELIERLRLENGHPQPRLEDVPFRPRRRRGGGIGANGDLLLDPVSRLLGDWLPFPPRVEISTLGEAAVLTGALAVGLQAALENVFAKRPSLAAESVSGLR